MVKRVLIFGFRVKDINDLTRKYEIIYRPKCIYSLLDVARRMRLLSDKSVVIFNYSLYENKDVQKAIESISGRHLIITICNNPEDLRMNFVEKCDVIKVDDIASFRNERLLEIIQIKRQLCDDHIPVDITHKKISKKSKLVGLDWCIWWWMTKREIDDYE